MRAVVGYLQAELYVVRSGLGYRYFAAVVYGYPVGERSIAQKYGNCRVGRSGLLRKIIKTPVTRWGWRLVSGVYVYGRHFHTALITATRLAVFLSIPKLPFVNPHHSATATRATVMLMAAGFSTTNFEAKA